MNALATDGLCELEDVVPIVTDFADVPAALIRAGLKSMPLSGYNEYPLHDLPYLNPSPTYLIPSLHLTRSLRHATVKKAVATNLLLLHARAMEGDLARQLEFVAVDKLTLLDRDSRGTKWFLTLHLGKTAFEAAINLLL